MEHSFMSARLALISVAAGVAFPMAASAQGAGAPADKSALIESCADRKFETIVTTTVDGKPHGQKVKICGVSGQSDEDWKRTLEDAIKKVEANDKMATSTREQIISALKLEIAKLDTAAVRPATALGSVTPIPGLTELPKGGASAAPVRRTAPPEPRSLEQDYGSLKPLPPPLPPVTASLAPASTLAAARLPAPRIKLLCSSPADLRGTEECGDVYQNTIFTVRADEALTPGTSLRFSRKGDDRADVDIAQMKPGQSVRIALPKQVCTGVNRSSLEIQVMRRGKGGAPQVVDTHGPYYLRCSTLDF
jgi:hypothetical protein